MQYILIRRIEGSPPNDSECLEILHCGGIILTLSGDVLQYIKTFVNVFPRLLGKDVIPGPGEIDDSGVFQCFNE